VNELVREYWEREACGTSPALVGNLTPGTREWFERIEERRYGLEPFIHSVAQFTRHHGKQLLEIGVGAGTDHLQWARAGTVCHGVDLTATAIETTSKCLALYGFESDLKRIDAEELPFADEAFDVVYSWGVIHHSGQPERIVQEIRRVLRPGGLFLGMMYGRHSLVAMKLWMRYGLLSGRPWRTLANVVWHHMESSGTKAYTPSELQDLFHDFADIHATPILTPYDLKHLPGWLGAFLPKSLGWFVALRAVR
jgi:ubiquinone/menaquinone biosynthesis C-methylase UbiE